MAFDSQNAIGHGEVLTQVFVAKDVLCGGEKPYAAERTASGTPGWRAEREYVEISFP